MGPPLLVSVYMKSILTPAERLRHDRERKHRERAKLMSQGLRLRQIWTTDIVWNELQPRLRELGITRAKESTMAQPEGNPTVRQGASGEMEQGVS